MPRYLLSVWHDAPYVVDLAGPDAERIGAAVGAFNARLEAMGAMVLGAGLEPPDTALVVRAEGDAIEVTPGPRAAPLPAMGGFWVLDVADHDTAVALAQDAARATEIAVELRPFQAD